MKNPFTQHPQEVGETYFQHMCAALGITGRLALATHCHLIHAVFPFIHPPLGTDLENLIKELKECLPKERAKKECHLDEALNNLVGDELEEYEEAIDLYTTYGGD